MSLTAEVKVNGVTIGYVECRRGLERSGRLPGKLDEDDVNRYWAKLTYHPSGSVVRSKLQHRYGDGAFVLLTKALETLT
jgi:hypothetical protein